MAVNGIDVSDFQPGVSWEAVAASGKVQFVYSKASEGDTFTAKTFHMNHDGCKANGIPFGAYHFFRPYIAAEDQARHFLATINGYQGQLLPMVDVEVTDGLSSSALVTRLAEFNRIVEASVGHRIIVYASYGFWNGSMGGTDAFSGHPFWIAEYNGDEGPTLPLGFTTWTVWQHADNGSVPGIEGPVDLDVLNGNDLGTIKLRSIA